MTEDCRLTTPCYVVDTDLLRGNLELLREVSERAGCKILLAQKAFAMYGLYPFIGKYLHGTTASSLHEARLGREEMGGETHIFAAAYSEHEFPEIVRTCGHIVFNSVGQFLKYRVQAAGVSCGLRVNPEYSELTTAMYDPCAPRSRLGVTASELERANLPDGLEGLHFHTMCEQDSDTLERTLLQVEKKFSRLLGTVKWINLGGGHHITRKNYDIDRLVKCVHGLKQRWGVEVYLEPGEAVALNAGFLVSTVLDIVKNDGDIAILDTSAACHMPDVLEMPYRPHVIGSAESGAFCYRLAGPSCLAGDVIGDYGFNEPLKPGDRLVFTDMAIYTMVKNNTFNGINLPAIYTRSAQEGFKLYKRFGYEDFKSRL